jgi:hypothetical protein
MLNLHLPSALGIAPYMSAGPSFALRLRCKLQFLGGGLRTNDDCEGGGARSKRFDLGVAGGAGIGWTIAGITLVTEARASGGLRTYVLPADVSNARSVSWSVLVGVSMPLNRRRPMPPVPFPLGGRPTEAALPMRPPATAPAALPLAPSRVRITITADDVDVHEIVEGIARATGYNVIVATQVHRRVSAALIDVPAEEAVQAIADAAGMSLLRPSTPGQVALVVQNRAASQPAKVTKP